MQLSAALKRLLPVCTGASILCKFRETGDDMFGLTAGFFFIDCMTFTEIVAVQIIFFKTWKTRSRMLRQDQHVLSHF